MIVKFARDFLDAERGFDLGNRRVGGVGLEQFDELLLGRMAIFVFADEIAVTARGCELCALGDDAQFGFFECVIQFDEGKTPVVLTRRNKRGNDGGFALTVAGGEIIRDEIAQV